MNGIQEVGSLILPSSIFIYKGLVILTRPFFIWVVWVLHRGGWLQLIGFLSPVKVLCFDREIG